MNFLIEEVSDKNKIIEEWQQNNLSSNDLIVLIKSLNDSEYVKECIENRDKYRFNVGHIFELIKFINDSEYLKECIRNNQNYGFSSFYIVELTKIINESHFTKEVIENREKYRFENRDFVNLFIFLNDIDYTKDFIEKDYNKVTLEVLMALIKFTKDPEFIIKCIKRRDKFRIGQWEVEDLIRNLGDSKYVLKCIKQYRELSFNLDFIIRLLEQYPNIYFEHFDEIIETFKEEQFYEDFIKRTLGDVELDEKNNPVITKEIRKLFLSDFRDIEQKYVKQFKNELPEIISKWQTVEKQIQIKKANSILNDGLEMRKGFIKTSKNCDE